VCECVANLLGTKSVACFLGPLATRNAAQKLRPKCKMEAKDRKRGNDVGRQTHTYPGNTDVCVCVCKTKTRSCTSKLGKSWLLFFPATLLLVWTELKVYAINFFAILFLFISQGIPAHTHTGRDRKRGRYVERVRGQRK